MDPAAFSIGTRLSDAWPPPQQSPERRDQSRVRKAPTSPYRKDGTDDLSRPLRSSSRMALSPSSARTGAASLGDTEYGATLDGEGTPSRWQLLSQRANATAAAAPLGLGPPVSPSAQFWSQPQHAQPAYTAAAGPPANGVSAGLDAVGATAVAPYQPAHPPDQHQKAARLAGSQAPGPIGPGPAPGGGTGGGGGLAPGAEQWGANGLPGAGARPLSPYERAVAALQAAEQQLRDTGGGGGGAGSGSGGGGPRPVSSPASAALRAAERYLAPGGGAGAGSRDATAGAPSWQQQVGSTFGAWGSTGKAAAPAPAGGSFEEAALGMLHRLASAAPLAGLTDAAQHALSLSARAPERQLSRALGPVHSGTRLAGLGPSYAALEPAPAEHIGAAAALAASAAAASYRSGQPPTQGPYNPSSGPAAGMGAPSAARASAGGSLAAAHADPHGADPHGLDMAVALQGLMAAARRATSEEALREERERRQREATAAAEARIAAAEAEAAALMRSALWLRLWGVAARQSRREVAGMRAELAAGRLRRCLAAWRTTARACRAERLAEEALWLAEEARREQVAVQFRRLWLSHHCLLAWRRAASRGAEERLRAQQDAQEQAKEAQLDGVLAAAADRFRRLWLLHCSYRTWRTAARARAAARATAGAGRDQHRRAAVEDLLQRLRGQREAFRGMDGAAEPWPHSDGGGGVQQEGSGTTARAAGGGSGGADATTAVGLGRRSSSRSAGGDEAGASGGGGPGAGGAKVRGRPNTAAATPSPGADASAATAAAAAPSRPFPGLNKWIRPEVMKQRSGMLARAPAAGVSGAAAGSPGAAGGPGARPPPPPPPRATQPQPFKLSTDARSRQRRERVLAACEATRHRVASGGGGDGAPDAARDAPEGYAVYTVEPRGVWRQEPVAGQARAQGAHPHGPSGHPQGGPRRHSDCGAGASSAGTAAAGLGGAGAERADRGTSAGGGARPPARQAWGPQSQLPPSGVQAESTWASSSCAEEAHEGGQEAQRGCSGPSNWPGGRRSARGYHGDQVYEDGEAEEDEGPGYEGSHYADDGRGDDCHTDYDAEEDYPRAGRSAQRPGPQRGNHSSYGQPRYPEGNPHQRQQAWAAGGGRGDSGEAGAQAGWSAALPPASPVPMPDALPGIASARSAGGGGNSSGDAAGFAFVGREARTERPRAVVSYGGQAEDAPGPSNPGRRPYSTYDCSCNDAGGDGCSTAPDPSPRRPYTTYECTGYAVHDDMYGSEAVAPVHVDLIAPYNPHPGPHGSDPRAPPSTAQAAAQGAGHVGRSRGRSMGGGADSACAPSQARPRSASRGGRLPPGTWRPPSPPPAQAQAPGSASRPTTASSAGGAPRGSLLGAGGAAGAAAALSHSTQHGTGAAASVSAAGLSGPALTAAELERLRAAEVRQRKRADEAARRLAAELAREAVQLAELHHRRALLVWFGMHPWLRLVQAAWQRAHCADRHRGRALMRRALQGLAMAAVRGRMRAASKIAAAVAAGRNTRRARLAAAVLSRLSAAARAAALHRRHLAHRVLLGLMRAASAGWAARADAEDWALRRRLWSCFVGWRRAAEELVSDRLHWELQRQYEAERAMAGRRMLRVLRAWRAAASEGAAQREEMQRRSEQWAKVQGWLREVQTARASGASPAVLRPTLSGAYAGGAMRASTRAATPPPMPLTFANLSRNVQPEPSPVPARAQAQDEDLALGLGLDIDLRASTPSASSVDLDLEGPPGPPGVAGSSGDSHGEGRGPQGQRGGGGRKRGSGARSRAGLVEDDDDPLGLGPIEEQLKEFSLGPSRHLLPPDLREPRGRGRAAGRDVGSGPGGGTASAPGGESGASMAKQSARQQAPGGGDGEEHEGQAMVLGSAGTSG
ncbi:hypothetical protein HYH03_014849 [Edaphochlamys debaryana]|uniref:Sfi1 spindle body domain-containing protein n=1 Tax=Edaphochlamys debaryana TaxID=47281 RepID=A0A835XPF8_9CHLO|nr:hypothetical protein HYH03_014849 [Edaphochlamys debaryana]|eukprot:KAG2486548.1 hypothetical protein HYH03_014849 [Edaphochlamys debaryana]